MREVFWKRAPGERQLKIGSLLWPETHSVVLFVSLHRKSTFKATPKSRYCRNSSHPVLLAMSAAAIADMVQIKVAKSENKINQNILHHPHDSILK